MLRRTELAEKAQGVVEGLVECQEEGGYLGTYLKEGRWLGCGDVGPGDVWDGGDVSTIGNGEAYEMLSCFVRLVEYARVTGDREVLHLVLEARGRIADIGGQDDWTETRLRSTV